jgi:hypothetical protein
MLARAAIRYAYLQSQGAVALHLNSCCAATRHPLINSVASSPVSQFSSSATAGLKMRMRPEDRRILIELGGITRNRMPRSPLLPSIDSTRAIRQHICLQTNHCISGRAHARTNHGPSLFETRFTSAHKSYSG